MECFHIPVSIESLCLLVELVSHQPLADASVWERESSATWGAVSFWNGRLKWTPKDYGLREDTVEVKMES